MRTLAMIIAMLFLNQAEAQETVIVDVTDIPTEKGDIMFGLYSEGNFLKAAPDFSAKSKVEAGMANAVFKNIPEGEYAVAVYQDENGNHRLDFAASGMPLENYGFSNNPVLYGPPNWDASKFTVAEKTVNIEIKF